MVPFKQETQISLYFVPDYPRWNSRVFFSFTLTVLLLWASYNISKSCCLYSVWPSPLRHRKKLLVKTLSLLSTTMSSITKFLRVTCLKDWQSTAPPSVTWSAKMTACVYPWIISLCPKKITVSSTTLTKTWSQRRWNGVKEEIIMI